MKESRLTEDVLVLFFVPGVFLRMISVLFKGFPENSVLFASLDPLYPVVSDLLFL